MIESRIGDDRSVAGTGGTAPQPAGVELLVEGTDDAFGVGDDRVDQSDTGDHRVPRTEVDVVLEEGDEDAVDGEDSGDHRAGDRRDAREVRGGEQAEPQVHAERRDRDVALLVGEHRARRDRR